MNPLALLKLVNPKVWAALAIAAATALVLGYTYKLGGDAPRAALAAHVAADRALADRYAAEKRAAEERDRLEKEKADAKRTADRAAAQRAIDELRHQRDSARAAFLSKAPAGSSCSDGQVCFDGAQFRAAYGELVGRLRGAADECTAVEIDLDSAAAWARERRGD